LNGSQPITEQTKRNKLLNSFQVAAQRKAAAQIMYRMLETMAIRSNTTPDDILNDVISFEKVQKENIDQFDF
jgi:biotin carboxylase